MAFYDLTRRYTDPVVWWNCEGTSSLCTSCGRSLEGGGMMLPAWPTVVLRVISSENMSESKSHGLHTRNRKFSLSSKRTFLPFSVTVTCTEQMYYFTFNLHGDAKDK